MVTIIYYLLRFAHKYLHVFKHDIFPDVRKGKSQLIFLSNMYRWFSVR